ncbi:MAG TPA: AtpZ/AtpI family protein [Ktedonobacteraceae bacterium]|nr:AtpZ/AtpI family protein [Ktedonobacteraceae bacterium]
MKKKPPPSVWGSLALMGQLGFTIAIPLALGAWGGSYLDDITHTKSLYLLLGLLLGLIVGVYGAYRLFSRFF